MFSHTRPSWYKPDVGLASRMFLVMAILVGVYVFFGFFLFKIGVPLILLVLIAAIIAGAQLFFADKIALFSMRAREVSEQEEPELHEIIGRLAMAANLPKPRIALVNTSIPNAFATGRDKNHAVVAVTTALKNQLPPQELEAVLAHELTHILNRDMLVMTIATFFSMVAGLLTRSLLWTGMMGGYGGGYGGYGRRNNNDAGAVIMITLLVSAIVAVVSFILVRTLSRYRELAADRGSALITGSPENLASALLRISGKIENGGIPKTDFRQAQSVNALFIVPAISGESIGGLFATHPSTEERVKRLQAMAEQMEHGPR